MTYSSKLIDKIKNTYKKEVVEKVNLELLENEIVDYFKEMEKQICNEINVSFDKINFKYDFDDNTICELKIKSKSKTECYQIDFIKENNKINVIIFKSEKNPFDVIYFKEVEPNSNKYYFVSDKYENIKDLAKVLDNYIGETFKDILD